MSDRSEPPPSDPRAEMERRHPWLRRYHEALEEGDPPSVAIAKANAEGTP